MHDLRRYSLRAQPPMSISPLQQQLVAQARSSGVERLVVGALICRLDRVLLLRRKPSDFMGGFYELPSGLVEGKETLADALHREVHEETGLVVTRIDTYLGFFNYVSRGGTTTRQFNFSVSVEDYSFIKLTEHDAFIWAESKDLGRLKITEPVRRTIARSVSG